jgi:hypothetical protein
VIQFLGRLVMADHVDAASASSTVPAVRGVNTSGVPGSEGVVGVSDAGTGVHGKSISSFGVRGESVSGRGVVAVSESDYGLRASSRMSAGIRGSSEKGRGVEGWATLSEGVVGISTTGNGVWGQTDGPGIGVLGTSPNGTGVQGKSVHSFGVRGESVSGRGVVAVSDTDYGLRASSRTSAGIRGSSIEGRGVEGWATNSEGIVGISANGTGVWGQTEGSGIGVVGSSAHGIGVHGKGRLAALFDGDVEVTGDLRLTNADCAEDFEIADAETVDAGTVMVLGDAGNLRESCRPYDKRVAGVISGAAGYKAAIILDKQPSSANRRPLALLGKTYCKVDASEVSIEVGDLLTTSSLPGHAMKACDPLRAFGAVIGKALRPLARGQGMIPILVALQ